MKTLFARFVKDESGATAIEYSLIAAGIALALTALFGPVQEGLSDVFGRIAAAL